MDAQNNQATVKRRTPEEIRQIFAEFASSGMQQEEFCRSRGISRSTLHRYLRKQHVQNQAKGRRSRFLSVELKTAPVGLPARSGGFMVVLKSGCKIEVHQGFDAATLERLLSVLERE